ncbi:EexN family lipoprotein [Rhizobium rhizogenes]|uniref:EexN family lipoprotein n=1 Tax=Rhizobium rhizogenes TaxID=359 RepID=UPI0015722CB2|nr:EexN family lipoprotein [Rhizobium rhizogenes]NTF50322.1 EexN family lipoprotein [Rhizobium rhizogenes]NTH07702.1 EexN family lipoprotein [Rhizobium rhizogenes]NTH65918.1 EexN family lipoprotein [Rhizobium rhizogenes]
MKFLAVLILTIALTNCSKQSERVYSVDDLMADQALLSDMIAKCRSNPGELRAAPNCVNAEAADGKSRLLGISKAPGG